MKKCYIGLTAAEIHGENKNFNLETPYGERRVQRLGKISFRGSVSTTDSVKIKTPPWFLRWNATLTGDWIFIPKILVLKTYSIQLSYISSGIMAGIELAYLPARRPELKFYHRFGIESTVWILLEYLQFAASVPASTKTSSTIWNLLDNRNRMGLYFASDNNWYIWVNRNFNVGSEWSR